MARTAADGIEDARRGRSPTGGPRRDLDACNPHVLAQLRRLRAMSVAEATTLLALVGVAVPLKYVFDWPIGVRAMGPIHGLTFLAYVWTALATVGGGGWRPAEIARLFGMAFIPFGGFALIPLLRRKMALARSSRAG